MMKTVLFICSGNFYRSRFAETLFNWAAQQHGMAWRAESRGFRLYPENIGPISPFAVACLKMRGIALPEPVRFPMVAAKEDFELSHLVIAVKEAEHRPMMIERFPAWADQTEYWRIQGIGFAHPEEALVELESKVQSLISRLLCKLP